MNSQQRKAFRRMPGLDGSTQEPLNISVKLDNSDEMIWTLVEKLCSYPEIFSSPPQRTDTVTAEQYEVFSGPAFSLTICLYLLLFCETPPICIAVETYNNRFKEKWTNVDNVKKVIQLNNEYGVIGIIFRFIALFRDLEKKINHGTEFCVDSSIGLGAEFEDKCSSESHIFGIKECCDDPHHSMISVKDIYTPQLSNVDNNFEYVYNMEPPGFALYNTLLNSIPPHFRNRTAGITRKPTKNDEILRVMVYMPNLYLNGLAARNSITTFIQQWPSTCMATVILMHSYESL